jgi:hypothetical protein
MENKITKEGRRLMNATPTSFSNTGPPARNQAGHPNKSNIKVHNRTDILGAFKIVQL